MISSTLHTRPALSSFPDAVTNVNKALEGKPVVSILELQKGAIKAGPAIRNNGGGHCEYLRLIHFLCVSVKDTHAVKGADNHALFWKTLSPASKVLTFPLLTDCCPLSRSVSPRSCS